MTVTRRPSLLEPGEPLLLSRSAIGTIVRYRSFLDASGIPERSVLSTPLCAVPLPIYADFGVHADGRPRRRWEGTRAEFMWHPLMWLPARVACRYQINDQFGNHRLEDDHLWAIRMAFELTASGLYDSESGTWLDILATVGIDITDELDLARVQDWLDGVDDPVLDDIDLSDYMDIEPSNWAMLTSIALFDDITHGSWALIADDLVGMIDQAVDPRYNLPHGDLLMALRSVTSLGCSMLRNAPTALDDAEPNEAFFERLHGDVDLDAARPDQMTAVEHLVQVRERLLAIREANWPSLERIGQPDEGEAALAPA